MIGSLLVGPLGDLQIDGSLLITSLLYSTPVVSREGRLRSTLAATAALS